MSGSLKLDLNNLGLWLVHWNLTSTDLVDVCFTEILSRPSWSLAASRLTWSQPWLMTASLKFDLGRLGPWLVHCNLFSTTFVVDWFTEIWPKPSWSMVGSVKLDLNNLGWWLVYPNLISTVLVHGWFSETWFQPPWLMAGSHLTWSQPPWLMASSLKFDLNHLCCLLVHSNLISAVLFDGWLISTVLVDGWLTETWSRLSWSIAGSLKLDLVHLGRRVVHWNLISTTLVDDWFTEIWTRPSS